MKAISKLINKEQYTDIQFKHIVLENYLLQHLALYIYIYIYKEREGEKEKEMGSSYNLCNFKELHIF